MFVTNTLKLSFSVDRDIPLSMQLETYNRDRTSIGYYERQLQSIETHSSSFEEIYINLFDRESLLELGICPHYGMLTSIKLVRAARWAEGNLPILPALYEIGLPRFDLQSWDKKQYIDRECQIELLFIERAVLLILDRAQTADKMFESENLTIGITKSFISWILIQNLDNQQINYIKNTIAYDLADSNEKIG